MSSNSEKSFGARLQKGNTVYTYTSTFQSFSPPREEDKPESMKVLLDSISVANAEVVKANEAYTQAVSHRQDLFKDSPASMSKRLSPIIGFVEAQYSKKSVEYKLIASLNKKIRSSRVEKAPMNPDDPNAKEKISNSTRSYGSLTQHFKDIISNLEQFGNYKPANAAITIEALTTFATELTDSNQNVAVSFQKRSENLDSRLNMYADLKERVTRIKAYTKSQYGNNSREHKLIKGIDI